MVERLQNAGLVIIGKTNLDEFAMGGSTETSIFGCTKNPRDLVRTAGGSSAWIGGRGSRWPAPLSIARIPVAPFASPPRFAGSRAQPTYGRISRFGLIAFCVEPRSSRPFAHHAEDLALLMEVIAGHDPRDSTSLNAPVSTYHSEVKQGVKGLRIGLLNEQLNSEGLNERTRQAIQDVATFLKHEARRLSISTCPIRNTLCRLITDRTKRSQQNLARVRWCPLWLSSPAGGE